MMRLLFSAIVFSMALPASALTLTCTMHKNFEAEHSRTLEIQPNQKTFFGESLGIRSYLQINDENQLTIEIYVPTEDMRIYGQGKLTSPGDEVLASFWSREQVMDIRCQAGASTLN